MTNPQRNYEAESNYIGLNKILFGTLSELKRKEIEIDTAVTVSQIADKIIKNNLTAILDKKRRNDDSPLEYFEAVSDHMLIPQTKKQLTK